MIHKILAFAILLSFSSCIGNDYIDDFVEPVIRIENTPSSIKVGESYQLEYDFFNNVGKKENGAQFILSSSDETIITVQNSGLLQAVSKGNSTIRISTDFGGKRYSTDFQVEVSETTIVVVESKSGTIKTTSSYALSGDFTIEKTDSGIVINIAENYNASTALPGLFIYLTNNKNTNVGAKEIGAVKVFKGAHSYNIDNVSISDFSHILYFCKPFSVKVGDGEIN